MKKSLFVLMVFSVLFINVFAQNKLCVNGGCLYYIYNSENFLEITEDKDINFTLLYGFNFKKENVNGYNISFSYNYSEKKQENAVKLYSIGAYDLYHEDDKGIDLELINHYFDLAVYSPINNYVSWGFGPSYVITNRTVSYLDYLNDKLASAGLGLNSFIDFCIPLKSSNFFIACNSTIRFTHSFWFDEGLRKLDDYSQKFFTCQLSIGIGYAF